jgi:tRNA G10  N-methylase Trm11
MYIALLGRQPALSVAELEVLYGSSNVQWFSGISATISTEDFDFNRLGGTQKAGRVVAELKGNWRQVGAQIAKNYEVEWAQREGKITLGISAYGFRETARDIQKTGLILKKKLREHGVSMRLIPNAEPALNTATSHHNKLGLNDSHVELLIVRAGDGRVIIAESIGAQNITAFAARDQARPKTDAFVGMLPPKLARMMVNLSGVQKGRVLDPFCGTGVVLQEAALLGFDVYGTDLSDKMIDYSGINLEWLNQTHHITVNPTLKQADAMTAVWDNPIDAIACETYLGQPFSAPPSPAKLTEVRGNCNHIISAFLTNLFDQIPSGTPLCIAVPAWKSKEDTFTHLPFIAHLDKLGYRRRDLTLVNPDQLLYYRENQVVARELLLLEKA